MSSPSMANCSSSAPPPPGPMPPWVEVCGGVSRSCRKERTRKFSITGWLAGTLTA